MPPVQAADRPEAAPQKHTNPQRDQERSAKQSSAVQRFESQPPQRESGETADEVNRQVARYTLWVALFTGLLVVATVLLAISAFLQAWITRNGIKRQLRAYVFIEEGEFTVIPPLMMPGVTGAQAIAIALQGPQASRGVLRLKNSGMTPAYDVQVFNMPPWLDAFPKPRITGIGQKIEMEYAPKTIIPPGGSVHQPLRMVEPLIEAQIQRLRDVNGGVAIYVLGYVEYRDAFRRRYRTRFRLMYSGRTAFLEHTKLAVCDEGNTEERITLWSRCIDALRASVPRGS